MVWITSYQRWLSETESLNNAQEVINHFIGTDWVKESISAMCGNMRHESSINPDMYEYGYDWSADRGYGLVQWTPRSKYWDWAVGNGLDPKSGDSMLARIDYEVINNIQWIPKLEIDNMTFAQFRSNSKGWSVDDLTSAFTWGYERPNRTAGENSMYARRAFANRVFNELDFSGTGGGKPFYPAPPNLVITSPWAMRDGKFHGGIDIGGGGSNHPIYATQSGKVIVNQFSSSGGWMVYIQHTGDPYFSRYLHFASQSPIPVGTNVTKGQEIGTMGETGDSQGIHLHFEVAFANSGWNTQAGTMNPELYLQMNFGGDGEEPTKPKTDLYTLYLSGVLRWS